MTWSAGYVLAGLVLTLWLVRLWIRRRAFGERVSRPRELADAELVYMEKLFRVREPIRLVAKVDRVYRLPHGALTVVELKIRSLDRYYLSDVIQLSAQRLAIEVQTGMMVEPYAYVCVLGPDRVLRSHRVELLDRRDLVMLYRRRMDVLEGRVRPDYARSTSVCPGCVLRMKCDRFPGTGSQR